jgi:hypothetical protein
MKRVYFSRIRSPCFYSHVIYGSGAFQFIRESPFLTLITCRFSPLLAVVFCRVPKFCLKVPKFCPSALIMHSLLHRIVQVFNGVEFRRIGG